MAIAPDDLRAFDLFAGLPDDVLAWLVERSEVVVAGDGDIVVRDGEAADHMIVVLSGRLELRPAQANAMIPYDPGGVTGVLPYSRMTHYRANGTAVGPTRLLKLHRDHFDELVQVSHELGQRLVAVMSSRVRDFAQRQQQHEKMLALGKLSAGLAHELNNPAAAVQRATATLRTRFDALPGLIARLSRHDLTEAQVCRVDAVWKEAAARPAPNLSALDRGAREDDVADWLEDHDVEEPWLRAETFVSAGLAPEDLDRLAESLPPEAVADAVAWAEGMLSGAELLGEVSAAAVRISDLVGAVKQYSHMDRAQDRRPTDVHEGLHSTLTLLAHKFRRKDARIVRDWADALPPVLAFGGQLNQVWTNLLDNAADAVPEGGEIRVETEAAGPSVRVRIVDDGPGIPEDARSRIFEPFFTTKGVGEGTGLGLEIVHRIVEQHGGTVEVSSRPGRTVFEVSLPVGEG